MALERKAGFQSGIATDPADTAAGYLTPDRYNLAHTISGADVGGIPYCPTATTETTSANLTYAASTGEGLVVGAGTATTDLNAFRLTQTMNAALVAFTGAKWTFTEGASGTAAGTLLLDILYGTSGAEATKFSVSKAGVVSAAESVSGTVSFAPVLDLGTATAGLLTIKRIDTAANSYVSAGYDGTSAVIFTNSTGLVGWTSSSTNSNASRDTAFSRIGAGIVALGNGTGGSFTGALQLTTIELGHASDTTLSRSSAGVLAVEGVVIPSISSTNTLTNKRMTKRTGTTTSSATPTINTDNVDAYFITAQTEAITSFTTNLSGTPTEGQALLISITGTAARAITWGTSFEASTVALPTTTVSTNRLDVAFIWNTVSGKWRCTGSA